MNNNIKHELVLFVLYLNPQSGEKLVNKLGI